jgi:hypothetical protein
VGKKRCEQQTHADQWVWNLLVAVSNAATKALKRVQEPKLTLVKVRSNLDLNNAQNDNNVSNLSP